MLQHTDKDDESKLEGELSPQTSNNVANQKETLSLQHNQCDKELLNQRNLGNKLQSSASDDKEGTTDTSHYLTHQELKCPTLDNKEGTTIIEPILLDARTLPWSKEVPAIDNATRGRNPHRTHELIKHPDMTRLWMT